MSYTDFEIQQLRRAILRFLLKQADGQMSEQLLVMHLEGEAFFADQAKRRGAVAYLADRGLVTTRFIGAIMMVQLLERGRIVALGKERVEGVADMPLPTG